MDLPCTSTLASLIICVAIEANVSWSSIVRVLGRSHGPNQTDCACEKMLTRNRRYRRASVSMGMVVRLHLVLEVAHFLLQFLHLLFERFHPLFDLGMFVALFFDWHAASSSVDEILAFERLGFQSGASTKYTLAKSTVKMRVSRVMLFHNGLPRCRKTLVGDSGWRPH